MFEGLDQIAKAAAGGLNAQDSSFWKAVAENGKGDVEDVKARRDEVSKAIEDRLRGQQVKKGESDATLRDPSSPVSRAFQATVKRFYGDKLSDEDLQQISAADRELVMDPLKLKETITPGSSRRTTTSRCEGSRSSSRGTTRTTSTRRTRNTR
jgi:hypothetical protein